MTLLVILTEVVTADAGGGWLVGGGAASVLGRWTVPMRPASFQRIPLMTVRTVWAACPKGTPVMLMRDWLDVVLADEDFTHLYPPDGRPDFSPGLGAMPEVARWCLFRCSGQESG